jgi:hypothetical protein
VPPAGLDAREYYVPKVHIEISTDVDSIKTAFEEEME